MTLPTMSTPPVAGPSGPRLRVAPDPGGEPALVAALDRLTAEVRALRAEVVHLRGADRVLDFGRLVIDLVTQQVRVDGEGRTLPQREWKLLLHLASRPGQALTHDDLLLAVWGTTQVNRTSLTEHVHRIRARLSPLTPISTLHTVGYRWDWHLDGATTP